jgi:tRNA(Ile2) C34 agmatinyltransferase TiaS
MRKFRNDTYDKYVKILEEMEKKDKMFAVNEFLRIAKYELRDAQEKVNFIEYYQKYACPECAKLMNYRGDNLYQCPKCKYAVIIVGINLGDE